MSSFVTEMDFSEMGVELHGTCPEEKQMCACCSGCFSCICCLGLELWLSLGLVQNYRAPDPVTRLDKHACRSVVPGPTGSKNRPLHTEFYL